MKIWKLSLIIEFMDWIPSIHDEMYYFLIILYYLKIIKYYILKYYVIDYYIIIF